MLSGCRWASARKCSAPPPPSCWRPLCRDHLPLLGIRPLPDLPSSAWPGESSRCLHQLRRERFATASLSGGVLKRKPARLAQSRLQNQQSRDRPHSVQPGVVFENLWLFASHNARWLAPMGPCTGFGRRGHAAGVIPWALSHGSQWTVRLSSQPHTGRQSRWVRRSISGQALLQWASSDHRYRWQWGSRDQLIPARFDGRTCVATGGFLTP